MENNEDVTNWEQLFRRHWACWCRQLRWLRSLRRTWEITVLLQRRLPWHQVTPLWLHLASSRSLMMRCYLTCTSVSCLQESLVKLPDSPSFYSDTLITHAWI